MMKKPMLCVLCFVFILSIAGCGYQAKADEAAEEMITLTLTPEYAGNVTDEGLEANVGTDYQSFERQADDSIALKMTAEQYANYIEYIRSGIISAARNMAANERNNIADISFNDDFSEFRVTVNTDTLYRSDADTAYYTFTALGRFYHYLTTSQYLTTGLEAGFEDYPLIFTYLDADGSILEEDYKPE